MGKKDNSLALKFKIIIKYAFNWGIGYIFKLTIMEIISEIVFINLNEYLVINRWTNNVNMNTSVLCKNFEGKNSKEIKLLVEDAFISGFESIQYNYDRLIVSKRKTIKLFTHDYIINRFEDINVFNREGEKLSEIEIKKSENDPARTRYVIENLCAYNLKYLLAHSSSEIEEKIITKRKGIVTIKIDDIGKNVGYLKDKNYIRKRKIEKLKKDKLKICEKGEQNG